MTRMPRTKEKEEIDFGRREKEEINKYKSVEYSLCIGTKV